MLFSFDEIPRHQVSEGLSGQKVQAKRIGFRVEKSPKNVHDNQLSVLNVHDIRMGDVITVGSKGSVSMYQLVDKLLTITGPAALTFSTWAISQKPIEALSNWKAAGRVLSIVAVLDNRLKERKPAQYAYLSEFATVKSLKCHAKVAILENESWSIAVVGSANWTRNPRLEAYVILCSKEVTQQLTEWLNNPT